MFTFCGTYNSSPIVIELDPANVNYIIDAGMLYNKAKTILLKGKSGSNITLPASLKTIGGGAFSYCDITGITIPSSVETIGDEAFSQTYSSSITNITLPASLKTIGKKAFFSCHIGDSITIPGTVKTIGNWAFSFNYFTSITIGNGVETIGDDAFGNNSNITSINIPASVKNVSGNPFNSCHKLSSITVDAANTAYMSEGGILYSKDKKTLIAVPGAKSGSVIIPSGVTKIGFWAFDGCYNITGITIPNTVTEIEGFSFSNCPITSITIPASVMTIHEGAFAGGMTINIQGKTASTVPEDWKNAPWYYLGTINFI